MQPHLLGLLTIRDVDPERSDRRTHACTDAVAIDGLESARFIGRVAGVDESGETPGRSEPMDNLRAGERIVASADRGVALARAEAVERVPAHRGVAAGAKEQRARNIVPRVDGHRTALRPQLQLGRPVEGYPPGELRDAAAERTRRRGGRARAKLHVEYPSCSRSEQIVDGAPRASYLEVKRVRLRGLRVDRHLPRIIK